MEHSQPTATAVPTLKDLLEDGIYLLFLLRNGHLPSDGVEFSRRLAEFQPNVTILSARCLSQAAQVPYYLWRTLLRNRFGLRDDESVQASTDKWVEQMHLIWEADKEETRLEATQVLGEMIGLATKNLAPDEKKLERIFYLTRQGKNLCSLAAFCALGGKRF